MERSGFPLANWQDKAQFVNQNSAIAVGRMHSPENAFMGQAPTMVTYYHINTTKSTRDKGLQNVEQLTGSDSGNQFNKIKNLPLYGIPMMDMSMNDDEYGIDTSIDGSFVLPPNIFHPFPEDYFRIDHLRIPALFRVTSVSYDTPTGNGFFRAEFELWSVDDESVQSLENSVVADYHCIFDHIGTKNRAVIRDDEFDTLANIQAIRDQLRSSYLEKFYDKGFNALMFMEAGINRYLYDPMLNSFCNKEQVFEIDPYGSADCYLMYEEKRPFYTADYEASFFDRLTHKDLEDIDEVGCYYNAELTANDVSMFDYLKDERVKYCICYNTPKGPFNEDLKEYIPEEFLHGLSLRNSDKIKDPYEQFIFFYMTGENAALLKNHLDLVSKRRIGYNFHTFVFIPMILYCLRQCYNSMICDSSIMDDAILYDYDIKKGGKV